MYMTVVFSVFAAIAGLCGLLLPHLAYRLGYLMMTIYLFLAICSALINVIRRPRRGR